MQRALQKLGLVGITLALLAAWTGVPTAQAAAIVVTSTADNTAADGQCTLREALTNANDNAATSPDCAAGSGADTISFDVIGTIALGSILPEISGNLTINGPGAGSLAISGNNMVRVFTVGSNIVTTSLSDLTIQNGRAGGVNDGGGGIYVADGILILNRCIFLGNSALNAGGAIFSGATLIVNSSSFLNNTAGHGGGISGHYGGLTISNSKFSGNTATQGAGIENLGGSVSIFGSVFSGNIATPNGAGAIDNQGTMVVQNSTFSGNTSEGGSGIHNYNDLTVNYSTFVSNRAVYYGGGIANNGMLRATGLLFRGNSAGFAGAAIGAGNGSVTASCFENNTDPPGVFDVSNWGGGTFSVDGNWWNSPNGPNTGGETTDIPVTSFLTSRPVCGASAASADLCADGRLNCRFGDDYAILYNAQDDHAHPSLHTYCVDAAGNGILGMIVTPHDLEGIPPRPNTNTLVKKADMKICRAPVSFWVLTTGEYQVNIGPDYKGDLIRMIFDGLPPHGRYFKKCNVLTSFEWCSR